MKFNVIDVNDYDKAQIVMGGISLDEIYKDTLELKKYPNIYTIGEVMDIDGECGGFNLSWAWASALSVSETIMNKEK
jgi:predicted flavoprotein YhiN